MDELSPRQARELAQAAGIELDDDRANTIALRLSAVLDELGNLPDDTLADVEPLPTFAAQEADHE